MILCLDMDAFFASVEQAANPGLKNKPVAVIGSKERTVVVTCSYEARARGVRTGMTRFQAQKVCPEIILVPGHHRIYTYISRQVVEFLQTLTPDVEAYSIDEAFLDISGIEASAEEVAYLIKSHIREKFDITCSVGVGPNKLVAKMASAVRKPDGYFFVAQEDVLEFIDTFALKDLWGIGRRLSRRFADLGVFTPKDLRTLGRERLVEMFGVNGDHLFRLVSGEYTSAVDPYDDPAKSIGHSMTVPSDLFNMKQVKPYLLQLCEMVSARARKHRYSGRTISAVIRYSDMGTVSRRHTIGFLTSATHHLYETTEWLIRDLWERDQPLRLIGVSLSSLVGSCVTLSNAMQDEGSKNWEGVYSAIDKVNDKYGDFTLSFGSIMKCRRIGPRTIPFYWRPSGDRSYEILG